VKRSPVFVVVPTVSEERMEAAETDMLISPIKSGLMIIDLVMIWSDIYGYYDD
jgi:hypothetical protein